MTSGPFDISGELPVPIAPVAPPESLNDVREALAFWERARDRERASMDMLREAVDIARQDGATLAEIAAELGRTRQYVQKLLREWLEREAALEADHRRLERGPIGRMSGWKSGTPQCGGCKRFLKRADAVCPGCGYAGHGGYVGVPATTSYLERHR